MREMGKAMMGTGEAEGDNRSIEAAEAAISNPLLEDVSMKGATGLLINVTGGPDMTLMEVDEAANRVREEVDTHASIIFGTSLDPELEGRVRVSIIATGIESDAIAAPPPLPMPRLQVVGGANTQATTLEMVDEGAIAVSSGELMPSPQISMEVEESTTGSVMHEPAATAVTSPMVPSAIITETDEKETLMEGETSELMSSLSENEEKVVTDARVAIATPDVPEGIDMPPSTDAFIPPRPMEVQSRTSQPDRPEPFAEAAMTNGAQAALNRSGSPSLLERMTGTRRAKKQRGGVGLTSPATSAAVSTDPDSHEPDMVAALTEEATTPVMRQVEPEDRLAPPRLDEDLLDIPAFLRRQAN
tara:strand:+ start:27 stop:1103 length:1077 start_codon:yes stop_codon:yes gene_type:complete